MPLERFCGGDGNKRSNRLDLHFTADEPTAAEIFAVDSVLGAAVSRWAGGGRGDNEQQNSRGGHAARADRHLLLPVLHAIHGRVGWISPGALNYACRRLHVPPAEAFGVADFYAMFSTKPRPPLTAHVCDDIACRVRGAEELCARLEADWGPSSEPCLGGEAAWFRSPCLGHCERAPAVLVAASGEECCEHVLAPASTEAVGRHLTHGGEVGIAEISPAVSVPQSGQAQLKLLRRVGRVDPKSLDDYRAHDGFAALARAREKGREWVIEQVMRSNLVGRGGAAFPAGRKWQAVAAHGGLKYLVCNADESEPGTFKDRILMEGDPFALIEAMAIAAFVAGCQKGFVYIRGEYPTATARLQHAVQAAREAALLDDGFDIELRRGAGAYICGEETALFNSIEGFRGEPRNKPPYPTEAGLFGRPTLVNNVETLVNVPRIVLDGGDAYAASGTGGSAGSKLFCLSGHVARPGVYEADFGISVNGLIELAGGISGSGNLQAVLVGGAAGTFLSPSELDTPFTFDGMRAVGAAVGSAVVMPFDATVDLSKILLRIAEFFRDETCGQCVPCRIGAVRQEELLKRLDRGRPLGSTEQEMKLLKEIGQVMRDASICGLGQTASSAVESALSRFPIFR